MNKNTQRVVKKHEYYHNKVELLEEERKGKIKLCLELFGKDHLLRKVS